jgi:hypothetical protein
VKTATTTGWERAQQALRHEVGRVTALLQSVRDPAAPAVGNWNLAETAMHLSQVWLVAPGLAREDLSGIYEVMPSLAGTAGASLIRDIWELAGVTDLGVRSDPERDPGVIADRIESRARAYFEDCAARSADERLPWLVEGSSVSLATLTGHLLNKTVVHGHDIARADGRRFCFVFDDGSVRIEAPSSRGVDCHISADPVALLLVVWGSPEPVEGDRQRAADGLGSQAVARAAVPGVPPQPLTAHGRLVRLVPRRRGGSSVSGPGCGRSR